MHFNLSEPNLYNLILQDKARCACLIESRVLLYREVKQAIEDRFTVRTEIDVNWLSENLIDDLAIHPFIIAVENLRLQTNTAHEEYEGIGFAIDRGKPLAFDRVWTIRSEDKPTPLRAIFDLVATDDLEYGQFSVNADFRESFVTIHVDRDTLRQFHKIRAEEGRTIPSVYMGAVMEVLSEMRQATEEELKDCKWAIAIQRSLQEKGLALQGDDLNSSLFLLAQKLLDNPFNLLIPEDPDRNEDDEDAE